MTVTFKKIKVSKSASSKLSVLKKKTGLTPNLLCRIGLCLSLERSGQPEMDFDEEGSEFNRYTLTGDWDDLFFVLLRERLFEDGLDLDGDWLPYLKAHLNRGISMLHTRVKRLYDLDRLLVASGDE
jgi:DNA sulfur modification protein DndE